MSSPFTAHLCCPLCAWASVTSSPSFTEAERRVSDELLQHMRRDHPKPGEPRLSEGYELRTRSTAS